MSAIYVLLPSNEEKISSFFSKKPTKGFQLVVAARYLFVEYFFDGDEEKLQLYRKAINLDLRNGEDEIQFKQLIESIKDEGFKKSKAIIIDKDNNVINGTHRLATSIFLGKDCIYVRMLPRVTHPITLQERIEMFGLSDGEIIELYKAYDRMTKRIEENI